MTDEQQTMAKRITDQERERDELEDVLRRNGFVRCDIPACNCGSWHHKYGLPERWAELKDALAEAGHPLTNDNGNLMLNALRALIAERDAALADARRFVWWFGDGDKSAASFDSYLARMCGMCSIDEWRAVSDKAMEGR